MYILRKLKHLIYISQELKIPTDWSNNNLKGKVVSVQSRAEILKDNPNDTSWAFEILEDNNYELCFNLFGYIIQRIVWSNYSGDFKTVLKEYDNQNFCIKEKLYDSNEKFIASSQYKYFYSKNKITKRELTSVFSSKDTEYIFDDSYHLKIIKKYASLFDPMRNYTKHFLWKITQFKGNEILSIVDLKSANNNEKKYFYNNSHKRK